MNDDENISLGFPEIEESVGIIGKSFWEENWQVFLYVGLGILAFIVLCVVLFYIFKPRQKLLSAYKKAMLSINIIQESPLDDKAYVSELSDTLRLFLEEEYSLNALGLTSSEFIAHAKNDDKIDDSIKVLLAKFLEITDLIKFTGQAISTAQKESILAMSLDILAKSQEPKTNK